LKTVVDAIGDALGEVGSTAKPPIVGEQAVGSKG
jgi:hypothetical protein